MRSATLQRENDTTPDQGTPGIITCDTARQFYSLELPDRENAPDRGRILAGTYLAHLIMSGHFHERDGSRAMLYMLLNVPGRKYVELHWGNWAGDAEMGYNSDVDGCILQGNHRGILNGQKAITDTRNAVAQFKEEMGNEDFELTIKDA